LPNRLRQHIEYFKGEKREFSVLVIYIKNGRASLGVVAPVLHVVADLPAMNELAYSLGLDFDRQP
jgi:hypothetical protein